MNGKNVFDFVDPDILEKLEKLEIIEDQEAAAFQEERRLLEDQEAEDSLEIDSELEDAHEEVLENRIKIRKLHKSVTRSQLPRRVRDLTETEQFMEKIREDKHSTFETMKQVNKELTEKKRRHTSQDQQRIEGVEEEMVIDDPEELARINLSKKMEKIEIKKLENIERMKRKIQKNFRKNMQINENDRAVPSKLPRHLNSGKRGIGSNDCR